jgi:hypothetical protein
MTGSSGLTNDGRAGAGKAAANTTIPDHRPPAASSSQRSNRSRRSAPDRRLRAAGRGGRRGDRDPAVQHWAPVLATYLAPTTLVVALLYYFGYVRSAALYAYFGLDIAALGLSRQDYLLRAVDALYVPLGVVLLVVLAGFWSHWFLNRKLARQSQSPWIRPLSYGLVILGVVIFLMGIVGIVVPRLSWPLLTPLSIGVGVVFAGFGISQIFILRGSDPEGRPFKVSVGLLSGIVILSLFWAVNEYAQAYGKGRAETLMSERPTVIIDTKDRLFAEAPGTSETALEKNGTYRFRYRGYRLLAQSNNTVFLIPERWTPDQGAILALPNNDSIRLQFRAPK